MRLSWTRALVTVVVSAVAIAQSAMPLSAQFVPYSPDATQDYSQSQAHTAPQPYQAQPQYTQPQYTAMAFQGSGTRSEMSQPVEAMSPGQSMQMQSTPPTSYSANSYPASSQPAAAGCNCQSSAPAVSYSQPAPMYSQSAPATSYEAYPMGGCTSGNCNSYNTFAPSSGVGGYAGSDVGYGAGGGYLGAGRFGRGRRWFGGFYGLYLSLIHI